MACTSGFPMRRQLAAAAARLPRARSAAPSASARCSPKAGINAAKVPAAAPRTTCSLPPGAARTASQRSRARFQSRENRRHMQDNLPHDPCGRGVFFDRETFGTDHLAADVGQRPWREALRGAPLADRARDDIVRLHEAAIDYLCANFLSHRVWDSYHGRLGSGPRSVRKPVPTPGSTAATPELETRAAPVEEHRSRRSRSFDRWTSWPALAERRWRGCHDAGRWAGVPIPIRRSHVSAGQPPRRARRPPARRACAGRPAAGGSARAGAGRRPGPAPDRPPVARPLHASPHGRGTVLRPAGRESAR